MITEDYVGYGTAKLLKEKGFDWEVHRSYLMNDNVFIPGDINDVPLRKDAIRIPTLQMVMKWLREVHHCVICVTPLTFYCGEVVSKWGYCIWAEDNTEVDEETSPRLDSYEQACEAAINYCLKNLI